MDGNAGAQAMRLFDRCRQLRLGVLVGRMQLAVNHCVFPRLVNLDEVGAFLMLLADDLDELVNGVGVVGVGKHVLRGVVVNGVFVAAQDVDGVAADAQARAQDQPLIDGVAHSRVSRAGAFCAQIALGGEAGQQVGFGCVGGEQGAPGNRLFDGLQVFSAGVQEEMYVGVNQAREQRDVAQVDDFGPLRMGDFPAHSADTLTFDQNLAGLEQCPSIHLEQPRRMEHDRCSGGLLRMGCTGINESQCEDEQADRAGAERQILHDTRICRIGPLLSRANAGQS